MRRDGLVGLKLAHETMNILTLDGRRRLVRYLLDHPEAMTARERHVSVDLRSMQGDVRKGLSLLAKARGTVSCDDAVLSGVPCIKGTRIPAHDIAEMLANGDSAESIREAFPQLSDAQIELAAFYARAYPRRGRPRREPFWRGREPVASSDTTLDELPRNTRFDPVKFLIDECLSPTLATMARECGFPESTHVTWLGLRSRQDWALVRRAVEDGYVLVTHNSADFTVLMEHESRHPGLICMNVAHGLMSLDVQQRLLDHAMKKVACVDLSGQIVEITLTAERKVRFDMYPPGRMLFGAHLATKPWLRRRPDSTDRRRGSDRCQSPVSRPAIPESSTGGWSGNRAMSERLPPIASTVLRNVDSNRSLRCSSREMAS